MDDFSDICFDKRTTVGGRINQIHSFEIRSILLLPVAPATKQSSKEVTNKKGRMFGFNLRPFPVPFGNFSGLNFSMP